jgi:hypothetical protein
MLYNIFMHEKNGQELVASLQDGMEQLLGRGIDPQRSVVSYVNISRLADEDGTFPPGTSIDDLWNEEMATLAREENDYETAYRLTFTHPDVSTISHCIRVDATGAFKDYTRTTGLQQTEATVQQAFPMQDINDLAIEVDELLDGTSELREIDIVMAALPAATPTDEAFDAFLRDLS